MKKRKTNSRNPCPDNYAGFGWLLMPSLKMPPELTKRDYPVELLPIILKVLPRYTLYPLAMSMDVPLCTLSMPMVGIILKDKLEEQLESTSYGLFYSPSYLLPSDVENE